jgi:short-subunit dehydrogenase
MDKIKNLFDVNFYGLLYCTRAALPYMVAGAKIVNMSSAMALFPVPFRAYYGAVKSAVLSLTYSWRMELKTVLGIDMFAICPGNIKTNFTANRVKDFKTDNRYKDVIEKTTQAADKDEDKRIPVEKAALECFKVIEKKKHRPMYIIGGKFKLLYFVSNRLPKSCLIDTTANLMIKK